MERFASSVVATVYATYDFVMNIKIFLGIFRDLFCLNRGMRVLIAGVSDVSGPASLTKNKQKNLLRLPSLMQKAQKRIHA